VRGIALLEWTEVVGLDPDDFASRLEDPVSREALVAGKKEGLVNGVEETPTLLVNGRRWVAELEIEAIVSAVEDEAARARGELCGIE
jgi:predicted DsbA family dithiol-disulfide isomerase